MRLSVPERHELRIARQTLKVHPALVGVLGGPTLTEAWHTVYRLTGRWPTQTEVHPDTWEYNQKTGGLP